MFWDRQQNLIWTSEVKRTFCVVLKSAVFFCNKINWFLLSARNTREKRLVGARNKWIIHRWIKITRCDICRTLQLFLVDTSFDDSNLFLTLKIANNILTTKPPLPRGFLKKRMYTCRFVWNIPQTNEKEIIYFWWFSKLFKAGEKLLHGNEWQINFRQWLKLIIN